MLMCQSPTGALYCLSPVALWYLFSRCRRLPEPGAGSMCGPSSMLTSGPLASSLGLAIKAAHGEIQHSMNCRSIQEQDAAPRT
ncbi:hypothetical protein I79_003467 [Cricetulus griseus]|uniref:Uncharacterized protein n=1 Tax=Cricetulus griseus TaxID=10029 RepID=G3H019_CRIGR|nr:hypothetical protein I79_003467 [Cricetulus griseus]